MLWLLTRPGPGPRGPSSPSLPARPELLNLLDKSGGIHTRLHLRQLLAERILTHELLQREQRVSLLPDLLPLLELTHVPHELCDDLLRAGVAGVLPCAACDLLNEALYLGVFGGTGS